MSDIASDDQTAEAESAEPEVELEYGVPVSWSRGQKVLHPTREQLRDVVAALRDDGFDQLIDVTAADYLTAKQQRVLPAGIAPERFEVVVMLLSHSKRERVRLRVQVPADDPRVPSLFDLHPGSEYPEREVYDMFGIVFEDHPDLSRILMPEDWIGHPLRKDYPIGRIPVQFKGAPSTR
ncbi:MAG TPA: NADH-quinone oxidoreductase subunit C [Acidimicrobiales bacterium]